MPASARERLDLAIYEGATFSQSFEWKTDAVPAVPISLADYTGVMQIRADIADETPLFDLTTENGGIIIESPSSDGIYTIYIAAEDTEGICADHEIVVAVYDLLLEKTGTGERVLQQYGTVKIYPSVTRPAE